MPGLRIGIDVGGTFTHGVVLRPPGEVIAKAVTPTTHTDQRGVAAGVAEVLRLLLAELDSQGLDRGSIELVAHSTTQATNALLEGDVSGVHLMALAPPGEHGLIRKALGARLLDVGNGHSVKIWPKLLHDWETATPESFPANPLAMAPTPVAAASSRRKDGGKDAAATEPLASVPEPTDWQRPGWDGVNVPPGFTVSERLPVAIVQPLAGKQELREETVAAHYREYGHGAVCASEITQVLGLQARTRTAIVNAAMLPKMLATADFTEQAVNELLPGVPLQVVRGDGGAMSIAELRRQPVQSLLSGPAAGASAALHRSGLANAVFIEVGGTSTDITLIQDGRVRHRYATVGGQRLLVPALDLRTVAVGGGSMLRGGLLRNGLAEYGPRSAHIADLPYLFQAVQAGRRFKQHCYWADGHGILGGHYAITDDVGQVGSIAMFYTDFNKYGPGLYQIAEMEDGTFAALTLTDLYLAQPQLGRVEQVEQELGIELTRDQLAELQTIVSTFSGRTAKANPEADSTHWLRHAVGPVVTAICELAKSHGFDSDNCVLLGGGGGAPVVLEAVAAQLAHDAGSCQIQHQLISDHAVISAIGAALAVTCVSLSKSVASPTGQDIATLTQEVETRLAAQGAERVSTDYEFDPQRQVLTVTGRGSRPYEQDAQPRSLSELEQIAVAQMGKDAVRVWKSNSEGLWQCSRVHTKEKSTGWLGRAKKSEINGLAIDRNGRILWQGSMKQQFPAAAGQREAVLTAVLSRCTQYTDGGPALPGLALLCAGRFIPLDLGDASLIAEVLRWERLPDDAPGCFIVRG